MTSIFGDIFVASILEDAAVATMRTWFNTYLREIERQIGMTDHLPGPLSWNVRPENDKFTEDMLPALVVVSPGIAEPPMMEGDGTYRALWNLGVVLFNSAPTKAAVDRNSKVYAAAIRAILLQKRSLGGIADNCVWTGEDYDAGPEDASRTFGVAVNNFTFQVSYVVDRESGPTQVEPPDPDDLPGSEWHDVEETFVDVELVSTKDELPRGG